MKDEKVGREVSVETLPMPKDLHWRILRCISEDLGLLTSPARKGELEPNLQSIEACKSLHDAIRARDPQKLRDVAATFSPQCMIKSLAGDKSEAYSFYARYQVGSFLKKYPGKGADLRLAAVDKFLKLERSCQLFNSENYRALLAINAQHPDYLGIVEEMRDDIRRLIGDVPNVDSVYYNAKHGPGVSLGDLYKNGKSTEFFKWASLPYSVTERALPYVKTAIWRDPRWVSALLQWYREVSNNLNQNIDWDDFYSTIFKVVNVSKIATVPKSAETDRTIAIEPVLNVFLQLGVDGVIRKRLRSRWNYDLNDQSVNQEMSWAASVENDFVTLDLAGASDTVTTKICELLLPDSWYDLLMDLRTPQGDCFGDVITFEKISSMGNGYTFALESLIFGAAVRCAIRRTRSTRKSAVYGDDLIYPKTAHSYLLTLLTYMGFKVNEDKSFVDGPFRESCGRDSFLGYDVRPLFLKEQLQDVRQLFYLHNSLWMLEKRLDWTWNVEFRRTKDLILKYIPKAIKDEFYGPESQSLDTHLFSRRVCFYRDKHDDWVYRKITATPMVFNDRLGPGSFRFRKLMVSLKERDHSGSLLHQLAEVKKINDWDSKRTLDTGNAFDVTLRDAVRLIRTECRVRY